MYLAFKKSRIYDRYAALCDLIRAEPRQTIRSLSESLNLTIQEVQDATRQLIERYKLIHVDRERIGNKPLNYFTYIGPEPTEATDLESSPEETSVAILDEETLKPNNVNSESDSVDIETNEFVVAQVSALTTATTPTSIVKDTHEYSPAPSTKGLSTAEARELKNGTTNYTQQNYASASAKSNPQNSAHDPETVARSKKSRWHRALVLGKD